MMGQQQHHRSFLAVLALVLLSAHETDAFAGLFGGGDETGTPAKVKLITVKHRNSGAKTSVGMSVANLIVANKSN